jgi:hypothetical protein
MKRRVSFMYFIYEMAIERETKGSLHGICKIVDTTSIYLSISTVY